MLNQRFLYAAIILGVSSSAFAFHGHRSAEDVAHCDSNGDGVVTIAEIQAARSADFQSYDANSDASLSVAELQALMDSKRNDRIANRLERLDANDDGSISQAEFAAGTPNAHTNSATTLFGLADTDQNGALDAAEMDVLHSPEGRVWRQFARLDTDGDGVISETEYKAASTGRHRGGHFGGRGHRF